MRIQIFFLKWKTENDCQFFFFFFFWRLRYSNIQTKLNTYMKFVLRLSKSKNISGKLKHIHIHIQRFCLVNNCATSKSSTDFFLRLLFFLNNNVSELVIEKQTMMIVYVGGPEWLLLQSAAHYHCRLMRMRWAYWNTLTRNILLIRLIGFVWNVWHKWEEI